MVSTRDAQAFVHVLVTVVARPTSQAVTSVRIDRYILAYSSVRAWQAVALLHLIRTVVAHVTRVAIANVRGVEIRTVRTILAWIGAAVVGLILAIIASKIAHVP